MNIFKKVKPRSLEHDIIAYEFIVVNYNVEIHFVG